MTQPGRRVLVLGGARSGKSAHAESLLRDVGVVDFLATAENDPDDAEWAERIARRREHRPEHWRLADPDDVAGVLGDDGAPVLFDSVTAWLQALLDEVGLWVDDPNAKDRLAKEVDAMVGAWAATPRLVVAVSDEIGAGLAPEAGQARLFRDVLGLLNQRLAASADEVWFVVAGTPMRMR